MASSTRLAFEHLAMIGRRVRAEVREMGVAAELGAQTGRRRYPGVLCHPTSWGRTVFYVASAQAEPPPCARDKLTGKPGSAHFFLQVWVFGQRLVCSRADLIGRSPPGPQQCMRKPVF
jgi:hypothetical protein